MERISAPGFYWIKTQPNSEWTIAEAFLLRKKLALRFIGSEFIENAEYLHLFKVESITSPASESV